ncbi:hypothetical protein BC629DRAFT_1435742 [Irpex lacteus]|nr:hypothetical protein BC629DRAFT_1435742 [Irpex lacteus]
MLAVTYTHPPDDPDTSLMTPITPNGLNHEIGGNTASHDDGFPLLELNNKHHLINYPNKTQKTEIHRNELQVIIPIEPLQIRLLGNIDFSKHYIDVFVCIAVPLLPQSKVGRFQGDYTKGLTTEYNEPGITKGTLTLFTGRAISAPAAKTESQEECQWVSLNANIELLGKKRFFTINLFPIPQ